MMTPHKPVRNIIYLFWALLCPIICLAENLSSHTAFTWQIKGNRQQGPVVAIIACNNPNGPAASLAIHQLEYWCSDSGSILYMDTAGIPFSDGRCASTSLSEMLEQYHPDWVIELWESYDYQSKIPHASGSTMAVYGSDITSGLKQNMLSAAQRVTPKDSKDLWQIQSISQVPTDSVAHAAAESKDVNFVKIVTTGKVKNDPYWLRVRQQRHIVYSVLEHLGMLSPMTSPDQMTGKLVGSKEGICNVAIYNGPGAVSSSGHDPYWILRSIRHLPHVHAVLIGPDEIQSGLLRQFDSVLFGGGSSKSQAKGLKESGQAQVKQFVKEGGRYVGICAGAFLASAESYALNLLNARMNGSKGVSVIELEFTDEGKAFFDISHSARCKYSGGPVKIRPAQLDELPAYTVLANFDFVPENLNYLKATPAVIGGAYGKGYVIAFSPHPERYPGPQEVLWKSLQP